MNGEPWQWALLIAAFAALVAYSYWRMGKGE